ncbi:MAG: methyltransferase domain-containing protein [Myxococcota bacterium]|nr:methyltransferase domain-containing protein [Deltaproteobacteria bacterium]MDQ3335250.1 methyltransferase domain-containing protein [Myxococcota bacterium]
MRSSSDYALPRNAGEVRRLAIQAEMLAEATETLLGALDLRDARSCIDIGCGTGDAFEPIKRVAPRCTRIVGLDLDTSPARGRLAEVELVSGDLFDTSLPLGGPFDLVYSRYLLHHMPDPVAALARMWELTAPGGTLAVLDMDQRATTTYPEWEPYARLEGWIRALYVKIGLDNQIGHKLPHMFERAGIGKPSGTKVIGLIRAIAELDEFLTLLLEMIRDKLVVNGVASADEIAVLEKELASAGQLSAVYCYRPTAVGVWKRKA